MGLLSNLGEKKDFIGIVSPDLPDSVGPWFNLADSGNRLKISSLAKEKKTVLLDFWTYSCVNCLRTLPFLKKWHEKYSSLGLVIIGVHTPEFEFEKDPNNIKKFITKENIKYPIVADGGYEIWNLFANNVWPRKLLIDTKGKIRYDHAGEGSYGETEEKIRTLLKEAHPQGVLPNIEPAEHQHIGSGSVCYPVTQETYCGYLRGRLGNTSGYVEDKPHDYHVPSIEKFQDGEIYINGEWLAKPEYLQPGNIKQSDNYLLLPYHGLEVNAVMKFDETKPLPKRNSLPDLSAVSAKVIPRTYILVARNGKPIPKEVAGSDVIFAENAWSYLNVTEPKMYNMVNDSEYGEHLLKITPFSDGFQSYAFTFGGCQY